MSKTPKGACRSCKQVPPVGSYGYVTYASGLRHYGRYCPTCETILWPPIKQSEVVLLCKGKPIQAQTRKAKRKEARAEAGKPEPVRTKRPVKVPPVRDASLPKPYVPSKTSTYLESVAQLRAMPYSQYLNSQHWFNKRKMALAHYGNTCVLCNASHHLQVHHRTYERRGEERITDLIVLCGSCHAKFHKK